MFKKMVCLFLSAVCALTLVACSKGEETKTSSVEESKMSFDSVDAMKSVADGVWMNASTGEYLIIKDGIALSYSEELAKSSADSISKEGKEFSSFEEFYEEILNVNGIHIKYSYEEGTVVNEDSGDIVFELDDEETAFNYDMDMYMKEYGVTEDDIKDELLEHFIAIRYPNISDNKDVQYDKFGHVGKNFMISGTAELDDYYNWGYRNFEAAYFCIRIRPTGGSYSDEWYIYASRTEFKDLFEKLKTGSKSVKLIAQLLFADTGSNNMATLVEFF